jgi:pimeloyl-ACP methyl ester carboxylesterase
VIRFFESHGGKRIAYATDGNGPVLVLPAWWVSHVERDLDHPAFRDLFARLATRLTVVRYDRAGAGLSDRSPGALSLDEEVKTLEGLIAALGAERFALFGISSGGPPAIAYAARHPERVTHLLLFGSYLAGPRLTRPGVREAVLGLVRAHWGLGSKTMADLFAPACSAEEGERLATMQREAATAEVAATTLELTYCMDCSAEAASVRAPTLVLHRREDHAIPFEHGRELAAAIPGATLLPLAGSAHLPWVGDWGAIADAALDFVAPAASIPAVPDGENVFVREGEVWRVAFDGERGHFKHARGLADLALLLSRPGEELSALTLMDGVEQAPAEPILDERARAEIRTRIAELDEQMARAERAGSPTALRAAAERETLVRELRAATGLGGRRRGLADPAERARKAVSGRIREAIEKLRAELPALGVHLDGAISTGTFCGYAPTFPTRWRT